MPIQHAVLGLLARGPSYGYELKASFEQAIGPQWGELNIGHLYQILDRLVREGQVTRTVVSQRVRPDKNVYSMTEEGREALESWLEQPFVRQGGYRDDFFLKLFVAAELGPEALHRVARIQRESYLVELASLGRLRLAHREEPLVSLLIEAALLHTEANLRVVELADDRAERLAHAGQHGRPADDGASGLGPSEEERHGLPARLPAAREVRLPEAGEARRAPVSEG
ncbi:MAG TPA: PadR family transcriptional regulator [Actinomycetes bacterium]|jgi:DNA-binding PadR family transcriptional regulator|nr:PadR family transcriptional regulator [Actinomycetes bacterium]